MQDFAEAYKQLNDAQRQAVDTIDGPVLVIAGPGTGKTQLLSTRVANIIAKTDTDASQILCLTFTNKAATNMRDRLTQLIGPEARKVTIGTFHSFAATIMNEYPDYFWHGARLSVAPDAVQDDIIQTILSKLPLDNPLATTFAGSYTALSDVKTALRLAKEAGLTPKELGRILKQNLAYLDTLEPKLCDLLSAPLSAKKLPQLQRAVNALPEQKVDTQQLLLPLSIVIQESLAVAITTDESTDKTKATGQWKQRWVQTVEGQKGMFKERKRNEWWLAVAMVYEQYRDQLHQRGYYDYSDMLIEVLEQLQKQPEMRADIQERYLYVLIDEFQDTNAAQLRLAHLVADHYAVNNRPNLMAVGDDDQAIFAFNGAELNNVLGFQRSYPDTKLIVLTDNYRSTQPILDTATQIIDQADERLVKRQPNLTKKLAAKQAPKGKSSIQHISYPTREHQFANVAAQVRGLWKEGQRDVAVLATRHNSLRQIAAVLLRHNIPIRYDQQTNILEQEAIQQIILIAQTAVAISEGDRAMANTCIAQTIRHPMWGVKPKALWRLAIKNYSQPDWLDSLLSSDDNDLQTIGNWLTWLARNTHSQPLPQILEYLLGLSEGQYMLSPFRDYYLGMRTADSNYLETLSAVQLLRGMTHEFASRGATLADFVRFVELNLSTGRVIANESWFVTGTQAVQLLTIYKAKGLEFDHVFLVDGVESMWRPKVGGRSAPANLQLQPYGENYDDYIRLLYVAATRAKRAFTATSYFTDERGNELLSTPLLSALPLTTVTKPTSKPVEILEEDLHWPSLSSSNEKHLLAERLEDFSLSPTALIDFLNIAEAGPASFKERHLLRLPRPRSAAGSYGTAIHAALETAQRLVNTAKLNPDTVLDRFEAALRDEHLSPQDYDRYRIRGEKLLPALLVDHADLLQKGGKAEQRIRDVFVGKARLNGTLDRVDLNDNRLVIGDYKTGKALPSFETKNQTLAVKAWRHRTQLLFYALLAQKSGRFKATSIVTQMLYIEAEQSKQLVLPLMPQPDDLARLEKLIIAVWQHIVTLKFPDTTKYEPSIQGIIDFENDLIKRTI